MIPCLITSLATAQIHSTPWRRTPSPLVLTRTNAELSGQLPGAGCTVGRWHRATHGGPGSPAEHGFSMGSQEEWVCRAKNSTAIPWRPKRRKATPALCVVKGTDPSSYLRRSRQRGGLGTHLLLPGTLLPPHTPLKMKFYYKSLRPLFARCYIKSKPCRYKSEHSTSKHDKCLQPNIYKHRSHQPSPK